MRIEEQNNYAETVINNDGQINFTKNQSYSQQKSEVRREVADLEDSIIKLGNEAKKIKGYFLGSLLLIDSKSWSYWNEVLFDQGDMDIDDDRFKLVLERNNFGKDISSLKALIEEYSDKKSKLFVTNNHLLNLKKDLGILERDKIIKDVASVIKTVFSS